MHRVMRSIGTVGKELARGGPSPKERMGEKYGKHYRGFQGKSWMSGTKGVRRVGVGKYLSPFERKLAGLKIENKAPSRKWQPGRRGLREEDVRQNAYPKWVKMFGKQKADRLLESQRLDSPFGEYRGGREVPLKKGEENLMRTKGFTREDLSLAREALRGAGPIPYEESTLQRKEFTQEENVEIAEEFGKEFSAGAKARYEKAWEVERLGTKSAPAEKSDSAVPRSRWKISAFTGWGKRSNSDNK